MHVGREAGCEPYCASNGKSCAMLKGFMMVVSHPRPGATCKLVDMSLVPVASYARVSLSEVSRSANS
jgi:hypothetical protein